MVASALGGAERTLWVGDVRTAGLDWSPAGTDLLFADGHVGRPSRLLLSIDKRQVRALTAPAAGRGDAHGAFSPDGQRIAFVRDTGDGTDVYVMATSGGEPRRLTFGHRRITSLVWISDGHRLMFSDSSQAGVSTIWKLDVLAGQPERMTTTPDLAVDLATDRRGRRLAFTRRVQDTNIRRVDLSSPHLTDRPLIASARMDGEPDVSSDAQRIAFSSNRSGSQQIWLANADGRDLRQLTSLPGRSRHPVWSPDGRQIAFASIPSNRLRDDIYVITVEGGPARQLTDDLATDVWPAWSRDGRSIYFTSDRTGSWQLWKVPASGGRASPVTRDGGLRASESSDGRFLYYSKNPPAIWRMPVSGGERMLVLELPARTDWGGDWTVESSGIYFERVGAGSRSVVEFFNFATRQTESVVSFAGEREPGGGFVVSRNRQWLLYTERAYFNVDIMLVDDLR